MKEPDVRVKFPKLENDHLWSQNTIWTLNRIIFFSFIESEKFYKSYINYFLLLDFCPSIVKINILLNLGYIYYCIILKIQYKKVGRGRLVAYPRVSALSTKIALSASLRSLELLVLCGLKIYLRLVCTRLKADYKFWWR